MSDYTRVYDGAAKDIAGSTLSGADFDAEFDLIQTSNNTKADKKVPGTAGDVAILDVNGNLADSSITPSDIVQLTGAQTLADKIHTSPVINTGVSGTAIDTDTGLVADSDTLLVSQKAIKAYVDALLQPTVYSQNLAGFSNLDYAIPAGTNKIMVSMWDVDSSANTGTYIQVKRGGSWVTASVYDGTHLYQNSAGNSASGSTGFLNLFEGSTGGNLAGICTMMRNTSGFGAHGWVWNSLFNRFGFGNWSGAGHIESSSSEITNIRIATASGTWVSGGMQVRFEP